VIKGLKIYEKEKRGENYLSCGEKKKLMTTTERNEKAILRSNK